MKKILSVVAVATSLLIAGKAQAQLGINLGFAPQTYTTSYDNGGDDTKEEMNGLFVGVNYNYSFTHNMGVSIGLQGRYNFKNTEDNVSFGGINIANAKTKTSQVVFDVPILVNYTFNAGTLNISPFIGPTLHYAVSYKTDVEGNVLGLGVNPNIDWYDDNSNFSQFDLSLTLGVAAQYGNYRLFGGYNMGMMNTTDASNQTRKGSNWFIGLGYVL